MSYPGVEEVFRRNVPSGPRRRSGRGCPPGRPGKWPSVRPPRWRTAGPWESPIRGPSRRHRRRGTRRRSPSCRRLDRQRRLMTGDLPVRWRVTYQHPSLPQVTATTWRWGVQSARAADGRIAGSVILQGKVAGEDEVIRQREQRGKQRIVGTLEIGNDGDACVAGDPGSPDHALRAVMVHQQAPAPADQRLRAASSGPHRAVRPPHKRMVRVCRPRSTRIVDRMGRGVGAAANVRHVDSLVDEPLDDERESSSSPSIPA